MRVNLFLKRYIHTKTLTTGQHSVNLNTNAGVKKSLFLEPGTSKISGRTSIYFHSMSSGQVKNSVQVYLTIYFGQVN